MSDLAIVWINGELMPADEVRVSPFDLGLAVGWGVFETMPGYDGRVFGFARHYERLAHSASVLEIHVPSARLLELAVGEVLRANGLMSGRARIRLSLSGGEYPLAGGGEARDARGYVMIHAVAMPDPLAVARLVAVPFLHNERSGLSGCKTASYAGNVLALRRAAAAGADEAVVSNTMGHLCEGSTSNLFLVKGGGVKTPSLESGCLAGVTRAIVLELCREHDVATEECTLTLADVEAADEVFLTSSMREVQSARLLGSGHEAGGPVTLRLAALYRERVGKELGR